MSFLARTESSPQRPQNSGFALIITIVLMSMLVLLMVSMASLTRVETQIAANYQQVDQARSNALMALNIAIGELQAEAGPDQRITARADILDSNADTEDIDGVNQPYWTGVWKTGDKSPDVANSGSGPTQRVLTFGLASPTLADKSKTAKWLVSNPTPSIRVDPITRWTGTKITLARQHGKSPTDVEVPLVDLTATVPGLGPGQKIGCYGYWVADEGVKARVNIKDPTLSANASTELAKNHLHFAAPQAMAMEVGKPLLEKDLRRETMIDQVLTPQQLPLLKSVYPDANIKTYLPDITTYSYGVLADVRNGGLRKDLTAAFEDTGADQTKNYGKLNPYVGQKYTERVYDITKDTVPVVTPPTTTFGGSGPINVDLRGLLWGDLYRFYNYYKSVQPTVSNSAAPVAGAVAPKGVGDPEARPYGVSQANFASYQLNTGAAASGISATGQLSPICIGLRFDVALMSESQDGGNNFNLCLVYYASSIWYNPYSVSIKSNPNFPDQTLHLNAEKDTILTVKVGGTTYYCALNQANTMNRFAFSNNPAHTVDFPPGAIRVFAMSAPPPKITAAGSLNYPTASLQEASLFGRPGTSQKFNLMNSRDANPAYYTFTDFVAVTAFNDVKDKDKMYSVLGSFPKSAALDLSLRTYIKDSKTGDITNNLYNAQGYTELHRWGGGAWPLKSQSVDFRSAIGVSAGYPGAGSMGFTTNLTKQRYGLSANDLWRTPLVLCGFNMRMKGLYTVFDSNISNTNYSIPIFMGNSEIFNPISTTSSGCWNEYDKTFFNNSEWPVVWDYAISPGDDEGGYKFTTWGDFSAGVDPAAQNDSYRKVLADIPLQPMLSLGQFMHLQADYMVNYDDYLRMTFGSMFVGGSYANPGVPLDKNFLDVNNSVPLMLGKKLYSLDNSYLANQALFDSYFFSTVPPINPTSCAQWQEINDKNTGTRLVDTSTPFLNSRIVPYRKNGVAPLKAELRDMDKAAANLLLLGAFNINSTSEKAWYALLSSLSGNDLSLWNASLRTTTLFSLKDQNLNPIPRFWSATGNATLNKPWCGVRALNTDETRELAKRIVIEVKTRGPFLSMADFLNRRLGNTPSALTRAGALQAAIDNTSPDINKEVKSAYPDVDVSGLNGKTYLRPSVTPDPLSMKDAKGNPWKTTVGMPGYLMQQDLVQAFSPVMAARSDTFVIRTYGEKTDPLTAKSVATAYCEAVVQRLPDYVDPTDSAEATAINSTNEKFGRRFKIVSFRWLTTNDL